MIHINGKSMFVDGDSQFVTAWLLNNSHMPNYSHHTTHAHLSSSVMDQLVLVVTHESLMVPGLDSVTFQIFAHPVLTELTQYQRHVVFLLLFKRLKQHGWTSRDAAMVKYFLMETIQQLSTVTCHSSASQNTRTGRVERSKKCIAWSVATTWRSI